MHAVYQRRGPLTRLLGAMALLGLLAATLQLEPPTAHAQTEGRLFIESLVFVNEGNSGSVNATFTVTLSPASGETVTVNYATANGPAGGFGPATAPADYLTSSGTLTFLPTETTKIITVVVNGDTLNEQNDGFSVNLSNPVNATLANLAGVGVIINDDSVPSLTINDVVVVEGTGGNQTAFFTVSLSAPSGREVQVAYTTVGGTAVAGSDYTATSGTLVFTAGSSTQTIQVPITTDNNDEPNEEFFVELSASVNAVITDDSGTSIIIDDDGPPALSINDALVVEGDSGTTNLVFTINLQPASGSTVSVDFATADGSATAPPDYIAVTQPGITFAPGQTSRTVSVPVVGDTVPETSEFFFGDISNAVNATISRGTGFGDILDDDGPDASVNDIAVSEGTGGTSTHQFTVSLSAASPDTVFVIYSTQDNTAIAPNDYLGSIDFLVFAPGETVKTVDVDIVGDALDEPTENFFLQILSVINGSIGDGQGTGTIFDDDAPPSITISDANITEGNSGTSGIFTIELSAASGQTVRVNAASANGTAEAGSDYSGLPLTTLFFAPGTRTQNITIAITGDTIDEDNETFFVNLTAPVNATIADNQGLGIITDDDAPPSARISNVTVNEGNSGTVNASFTVELSTASGKPISLNYASSDGTATTTPTPPLPVDYNPCSGTISFTPGDASETITCQVRGDTVDEIDENFFVDLTIPAAFTSNVTLADARGEATITDDDAAPTLAINDVAVTEGNAPGSASFTVDLSAISGKTVTVAYNSSDGTARAPGDYGSCGGTLTFTPGSASRTITCAIVGDLVDEETEDFFVDLSAPTNATLSRARGTATITDNDPPPDLQIGNATVTEGNTGETVNAVFTISLSAASERQVRVSYATSNGTATAGNDYTAIPLTEVVFEPGMVLRNVSVPVIGDLTDELNETFIVTLSAPTNAMIADAEGEGTITDDDDPPTVQVSCDQTDEGDSGTSTMSCEVALARASAKPITVDYATSNGSATAPGDYTAASGTLSFTPGEASKQVDITIVGDTIDEVDETFTIILSGATNATPSPASTQATINDDDGPTVSIADASVGEGSAGATPMHFAVALSATSPQDVSVQYEAINGSATSPADYSPCSGTLTITAGSAGGTISCQIMGDTLDEPDEQFTVALSNATDATIGTASATGTIVDDDPLPALTVNNIVVGEGTSGTTNATFTVSLSAASGREVTVMYVTADGSATEGSDYTRVDGTLTFAPGVTSMPIPVPIRGDTVSEPNESFTVVLSSPANATLADGTGEATIIDSDNPPVLSIANAQVTEGNSGTRSMTFTVSLSLASGQPVTVQYASVEGSATSPEDYQNCAGTLTFAAGETSKVITCAVVGDTAHENDETFTMILSSATNATIGDGSAIGIITDNDPPPNFKLFLPIVAPTQD